MSVSPVNIRSRTFFIAFGQKSGQIKSYIPDWEYPVGHWQRWSRMDLKTVEVCPRTVRFALRRVPFLQWTLTSAWASELLRCPRVVATSCQCDLSLSRMWMLMLDVNVSAMLFSWKKFDFYRHTFQIGKRQILGKENQDYMCCIFQILSGCCAPYSLIKICILHIFPCFACFCIISKYKGGKQSNKERKMLLQNPGM